MTASASACSAVVAAAAAALLATAAPAAHAAAVPQMKVTVGSFTAYIKVCAYGNTAAALTGSETDGTLATWTFTIDGASATGRIAHVDTATNTATYSKCVDVPKNAITGVFAATFRFGGDTPAVFGGVGAWAPGVNDFVLGTGNY